MLKVAGGGTGTSGTVTQIDTGTGLTGGPITGNGTISLSVPVAIANGGTNSNAVPTSGAVAYGNGASYLFTSAGTSGQFLQSSGTGSPVWTTINTGSANVLISDAELMERRAALEAAGGYAYPASQTPWQEIQRAVVGQMNTGAILEGAEKYQRIAQTMGLPRDNH